MTKLTVRCTKCGAASKCVIPTGWEGRVTLTKAKCGCGGAEFEVVQEEESVEWWMEAAMAREAVTASDDGSTKFDVVQEEVSGKLEED